MMLREPEIEVIEIDLNESIVTASCTDSVADGGTYCVDSNATDDCGTPMQNTN